MLDLRREVLLTANATVGVYWITAQPQYREKYHDFSLQQLLLFASKVSLQIFLTQRHHCSQNAVIGFQLCRPYIKNGLTTNVFTQRNYCIALSD